ncbi:ribonuclease HII [Dermabacteraceae bacterium P7074]
MAAVAPTLELERALGGRVIGLDEVGRGALAGPVAVGACLVDTELAQFPAGIRDSKLLTPKRRLALAEQIPQCAPCTVGMAEPGEIDELGITRALALAAKRALAGLGEEALRGVDAILLDGSHDWLSAYGGSLPAPVTVRPKADRDCLSVAAASVVAKVARDELMVTLAARHPHYAWESNKGYGSAVHRQAILEHGVSEQHRVSWNLGGAAAHTVAAPPVASVAQAAVEVAEGDEAVSQDPPAVAYPGAGQEEGTLW